jgi:hypothetical protein
MDIMKTLSEMGEGMKRQLNNLANQFSRRGNAGYTPAPADEPERNPLINRNAQVYIFLVTVPGGLVLMCI